MIARFTNHHGFREGASNDPIVTAEQVVERHPVGIPALPFPELLLEQHSAWRHCLYTAAPGKASIERFVATVARLEREGASR